MPWGAVAGAVAGSVANKALSSDKGGGAGTTTASKEPWAEAAPWLKGLLSDGQAMQQQYQQNPFNAQQLASYESMGRQGAYMNQLVPGLLGQLGGQQTGFDRSNPNGRPAAFNFNGAGNGGATGLLANLSGSEGTGQYTSAANPAAPPAAPVVNGNFTQQTDYLAPSGSGLTIGNTGAAVGTGDGGYGSFKYGMQPEKGTQAYRDMQEFLAWGGEDPYGMYGGKSKFTAPDAPQNFTGQYGN